MNTEHRVIEFTGWLGMSAKNDAARELRNASYLPISVGPTRLAVSTIEKIYLARKGYSFVPV